MKLTRVMMTLAAFMLIATSATYAKSNRVDQMRDQADKHYQAKDYRKAYDDYDDLAGMGDKFAQYRLSVMNLEGLGTNENVVEAYAWAALAAEADNKSLRSYRDTVWKLVPAEQQKKAKSRAKKLSGRYGDLALARKSKRQATRQLRSCTGSRLGSSCEFVQVSSGGSLALGGNPRLSSIEAASAGLTGAEAGVGNAQTGGAGSFAGGETNPGHYMKLRESLKEFNRIIDDQLSGTVELGEFEVIEEDSD